MHEKDRKKDEKSIITQYLSEIGAIGGRRSKGGGRPRIPEEQMTPAQKKRRARYEAEKRAKK